jgi:dTDP-4-dehydrorhamnose 3,5-epimerase
MLRQGRFEYEDAPINGVKFIRKLPILDDRGVFTRLYDAEEMRSLGWQKPIADINLSFTRERGTVRGMHYQLPPYAESKLIWCVVGVVFDVLVDLRFGSPTFLETFEREISSERQEGILAPEGIAHGFQTLTDHVEMLYCHSAPFRTRSQANVNPLDQRIAISWPLAITNMSQKDSNSAFLSEDYKGITL